MKGGAEKKKKNFSLSDPRVKIILLAGMLGLIITNKGCLFQIVVLTGSFIACARAGIPARKVLHRLGEPLYIAAVLLLIKSLSGREAIAGFGIMGLEISIYKDGMLAGLRLALRVLAAVGVLSAVSLSTPFNEMLSGLGWFRFPKSLIEIGLFAQRYVKVFSGEAQAIFHSQRNRLGYSSLKRTFNSFGILAGSLTIKAFEQAQATSLAMVQRGYDGNLHLSTLERRPGGRELLFAAALLSLTLLAWTKLP
ncbi:MAG: cobalt ECF transporter T component CbiQ [Nitrospiraceae bacterium]|nr:cobalt ECF transporter T component CbiQ [Nitrospiraceae bacterium]